MLSKSTIKDIRALRLKKFRQKYHKIVVEGEKSVREILAENLARVEMICASEDWLSVHAELFRSGDIRSEPVDDGEMAAISAFTTPQQVLAVCTMPDRAASPEALNTGLGLYMDGIRDPGNAGTIFRVADWFGIRNVFISADTVDPWNPKVIQASMSSLFRLNWSETELSNLLAGHDLPVFATAMDGENIYSADLPQHGLIILGNESTGVRLASDLHVRKLAIPRDFVLGADSLNVAVAAGIICSEFRRRQG